jgi:hypothetical protein
MRLRDFCLDIADLEKTLIAGISRRLDQYEESAGYQDRPKNLNHSHIVTST